MKITYDYIEQNMRKALGNGNILNSHYSSGWDFQYWPASKKPEPVLNVRVRISRDEKAIYVTTMCGKGYLNVVPFDWKSDDAEHVIKRIANYIRVVYSIISHQERK